MKNFVLRIAVLLVLCVVLYSRLSLTPVQAVTHQPHPLAATHLAASAVPTYTYRIVNQYPHDPNAFTQGLVYTNGTFYEGTGLRGRSSLRKVDPTSGVVSQQINLASSYFGEGIVVVDERIIQLTWTSRTGFVYDKESFSQLEQFSYPTEGWGITDDGQKLIMSDGTSTLYFWDRDSLAEIGQVNVTDNGRPIVRLNELEYIDGEVYANVWQTDQIARISPHSGNVIGWIDLSGLLQNATQPVDVLNGIAYDALGDRLFVTGKLWPTLFEIELIPTVPANLADRLQASYTFAQQADDQSGYQNHAAVNGATPVTGREGAPSQAYQFDGVDDYLQIPASDRLAVADQFGLSLWLTAPPQAADGTRYPVLVSGTMDGEAYGLWLVDKRLELCVTTVAGERCITGDRALSQTAWHHVVASYDGTALTLYQDDALIGQRLDSASPITPTASPIFIATDPQQSTFTRLALDDLRIYSRALNRVDVATLYEQRKIYLPLLFQIE